MKVQRQISWFDISNEELVGEKSINHIPLDDLNKLFNPPTDDPLLYNPYEIDERRAKAPSRWVTLPFNFILYTYCAGCFQA